MNAPVNTFFFEHIGSTEEILTKPRVAFNNEAVAGEDAIHIFFGEVACSVVLAGFVEPPGDFLHYRLFFLRVKCEDEATLRPTPALTDSLDVGAHPNHFSCFLISVSVDVASSVEPRLSLVEEFSSTRGEAALLVLLASGQPQKVLAHIVVDVEPLAYHFVNLVSIA